MPATSTQLVKSVTIDIYEIRGQRVMLDFRVAEAFGTETKRVNEAVARNAEMFGIEHSFQLTAEEVEAMRSPAATTNPGRGGARYVPHAFTMKGVARLATVLKTDAALRATDLIIDTFLLVYEQLHQGRKQIVIPEPSQYRANPDSRRATGRFRTKLLRALTELLDSVVDVQNKRSLRNAGRDVGSGAIRNIEERLRVKGLENAKLEADTTLMLAQAEKVLAEARKTDAEADGLDIQNLERRIGVVQKLIEMSRNLEPVEFVELLDTFDAHSGDETAAIPNSRARKQLPTR